MIKVSVIIPAYNEAMGIKDTLVELEEFLDEDFEILVIEDGGEDNTYEIVDELTKEYSNIRCIRHRRNKGYGSAIVTGCRHATGNIIAWYDADGQHRPEDLLAIISKMEKEDLDYCIGIRTKDSYQDKSRIIGKSILKRVVNFLAKEPMADFNSGMRAFRKEVLIKYINLLPRRFGASTVTSFIMQEENYVGGEVPIHVRKRVGKSSVKQFRDGILTISLIFNIIILFRPKEIFGSLGILTILLGAIYGIVCAVVDGLGVPVLSAIVIGLGIQILFLGILSSQISQLRLEHYDK